MIMFSDDLLKYIQYAGFWYNSRKTLVIVYSLPFDNLPIWYCILFIDGIPYKSMKAVNEKIAHLVLHHTEIFTNL